MYIDKLDNLVDKHSNMYHKTTNMKPADGKSSTCFDFDVKNNDRNPNFKVDDQVRTSKYKNIFIKG